MKTEHSKIALPDAGSPMIQHVGRFTLACWFLLKSMVPLSAQTAPPLISGFDAVSYNGWIPCDPIIAAGPSSLVTMVSGRIVIFSKPGAKLFEQNLGAGGFWAGQGADQVAEPWVIFDQYSQRYIASAAEFGNGKGRLYLAISTSPSPLTSADWHKYGLDRSGTHQGPGFPNVPTYPDYAKVGVDENAVYVTSSHFAKDQSITLSFSHAEIFALAKAPLLSGAAITPAGILYDTILTESYSSASAFNIHPAAAVGTASAMYFVQSVTRASGDKIVVHALTDIMTSPVHSVSLVPVGVFNPPPGVPQRGSSILLENIDARLMSAVVRDGFLWTAHAVVDPAADAESVVRWYQFDVSGVPNTGAELVQGGNVDPGPGVHAWLPAVNVDAEGNMGLVFSVGGADQYAAIGYTGRRSGDPAGETLPVRTARAGAGPYTQGGWGEYSGLAMDPDGYTFWLFHQYPNKQKTWGTFVGAYQLTQSSPPPAAPLHVGDLDRSAAASGRKNWTATVVVTMHDGHEAPVSGATVSIQWTGGVSASAVTDATGQCTFNRTLGNTTASSTLTVTGATHPTLTYSAAANHDPESDSTGTSITILKP